MKRYLLFVGDNYYPEGGWNDFRGAFDSIDDAINYVLGLLNRDWWHIVDTHTIQIVRHSGYNV